MRLPRTVEGYLVHEIAKLDVGSVLLGQPGQPALTLPVRAEGAINPDDYPWKIAQPLDYRCPVLSLEQNVNANEKVPPDPASAGLRLRDMCRFGRDQAD